MTIVYVLLGIIIFMMMGIYRKLNNNDIFDNEMRTDLNEIKQKIYEVFPDREDKD